MDKILKIIKLIKVYKTKDKDKTSNKRYSLTSTYVCIINVWSIAYVNLFLIEGQRYTCIKDYFYKKVFKLIEVSYLQHYIVVWNITIQFE